MLEVPIRTQNDVLALWLENKKSSVLPMNNGLDEPDASEKYIVVRLPQLTENIAVSALSILTRMSRGLSSFERISSLASDVFCRTSQGMRQTRVRLGSLCVVMARVF